MSDEAMQSSADTKFLALFLAGDAPSSSRARNNLLRTLDELGMHYDIVREVDVLETPQDALSHGIFANPALVYRSSDARAAIIYGDLSDQPQLRDFLRSLGLGDPEHAPRTAAPADNDAALDTRT